MTYRIAAYLVSLGAGYWILTLADKQNGFTKTVGRVIAWIMILVSLAGPLCIAARRFCCHDQGGACLSQMGCPLMGSDGGHPYMPPPGPKPGGPPPKSK